jgi:hypothetical protein
MKAQEKLCKSNCRGDEGDEAPKGRSCEEDSQCLGKKYAENDA